MAGGRERPSECRFGRWLTVEAEPETSGVLLSASLLDQAGEPEEATERLSEAIDEAGPRPSLLEARGALYLAAGFPRAAAGDFQVATELGPARPNAWYALGRAQQMLGLSRLGLEALDRAHALGSRESGMLLARARVLRGLARPGMAAQDYAEALRECPSHSLEILVEATLLARAATHPFEAVVALCERLEACEGVPLSDGAWLLRALLKELGAESEGEARTAFRALDSTPGDQVQLAGDLFTAIRLLDPETAASARQQWLQHESDPDRRRQRERCLALP
jgi:tetratricopeptide (TPR) repeat protein